MGTILPRSFFDRPTTEVARELLGALIVSDLLPGDRRVLMITETEAYDGPQDRASHASRGLTPRNRPMFGPPGAFYVYLVYGMHWMVNVVTGPEHYPAAVLLRAGMPEQGPSRDAAATDAIKGPGLLARYLGVTGRMNGLAAQRKNGVWFESHPLLPGRETPRIVASKRIGVEYAGPVWSARRYNFTLLPARRRDA